MGWKHFASRKNVLTRPECSFHRVASGAVRASRRFGRADAVPPRAVTPRRISHANQCRLCPEVVRAAISETAPQLFVNVICLIAAYQCSEDPRSLRRGPRRELWTCSLLLHGPPLQPDVQRSVLPWRVKRRTACMVQIQGSVSA